MWLLDDAIQSPSSLQPSVLPPLACWPLSSCLTPHGCKVAAVAPGIMSTQQGRDGRVKVCSLQGVVFLFGKEISSQKVSPDIPLL